MKTSLNDFDVFSSSSYKSRYVDITVDCSRYDDTMFKSPLNKVYEICRFNGYTNVVFVLNENIFEKERSFTPFYTISSEKIVLGVECDTIEPDDYYPIKDAAMLESKFHEFLADTLASDDVENPMTLSGYSSKQFFSNDGINLLNPLKRKILVLFDTPFKCEDKNLAKRCVDEIIRCYKEYLINIIDYQVQDAYISKICFEALDFAEGTSFVKEWNSLRRSSYIAKAEEYLRNIQFEYVHIDEEVDGVFEYKITSELRVKLPDTLGIKSLMDLDIDKLLEIRYKTPIRVENYFGVKSEVDESKYAEDKAALKNQLEDEFSNTPTNHLHIKNYTKKAMQDICDALKFCVLISYKTSSVDERLIFFFPSKCISNEEYEDMKRTYAVQDKLAPSRPSREDLAKLVPTNDDEVLEKMRAFETYDQMVTQMLFNSNIDLMSNNSFSNFYGKSYYDLCMKSE